MGAQHYIAGSVPERFVEVDAARLLLIVTRFARRPETSAALPKCQPVHPYVAYFAPEYYLHKLDFLLRNPSYFLYELADLFLIGAIPETQRQELIGLVQSILSNNEPELMTQHYRRFWRGAYERLDEVEAWWHARQLIYTALEPRGAARPWKYYFLTQRGVDEANRLVLNVTHARWYADRIEVLHRYFGGLSPAQVKELQYSHPAYRQAQIDEYIPDLPPQEIEEHFARVFGMELKLEVGA